MANHDGVLEVEPFEELRHIVRVGVHVVSIPRLVGAPMTAPVVRNDAIAALTEEEHLAVPVVSAQWPAMRKYNGLSGSPILVENLCSVFRRDCRHSSSPWTPCWKSTSI